MKINELMIGDWVCYGNYDIPAQIKGIDIGYVYIEDSINRCWLSVKQIRPIPITKENLKLNGFTCDNEYDRHDYIKRSGNQWAVVGFDQGTIGVVVIDDEKYGKFSGTLNYIHELQHTLRLCGLTELADNWKME